VKKQLDKFKERYGIHQMTITGKKLLCDTLAAETS
jgi:hypothetical protein